MHLRLPGLRRLLEGITILPIVIPPVVLIVGVLQIAPGYLKGTPYLLGLVYVVLAMPFAYRSLDAGLRALDLKTLVEASNSLGAGWLSTLWRVLLPNLRTALLSATVLTVALVLGEFTMASLDLYQTFPVWIVAFDQTSGPVSVAASLLALFVTWLFLLADRHGRHQAARAVPAARRSTCSRDPARHRPGRHGRDRCEATQHRRGHRGQRGRAASGGAPVNLQEAEPVVRPVERWTGCRWRSRRASWSRCSARPAAARPPRCASWPGFETADSGSVTVDGKDVSPIRAAKRDMGMVFQSYSLFPNMSALDNVGFGLRMRKMGARRPAPARGRTARAWSGCPRRPASTRTSCPAASSSGSRWPGRWPSSRGCCCSTSRCPPSTPRSGCSCGSRSARCSSGWASPPCSSPTTRRRRCPWPTGSG